MAIIGIELSINEKLFQRNPQHTELGRKILKHSVLMIDEMGLECFNFRKLAKRIGSTEASVYRYFENKHLLLVYLVNWHWEWMKFRIDMKVAHIKDPKEKLRVAISCIADTAQKSAKVAFIDEDALHRIVVAEGTKAYHHKKVDSQNKDGYFLSYKSLSEKVAAIILENNPDFPYPRALASNLLEMANNHTYFAEHLPRLTEVNAERNILGQIETLLLFFVERTVFTGQNAKLEVT